MVRTVPSARSTRFPSRRNSCEERVSPSADVFTASWCCSVGMTWTVELRSIDGGIQGRPVEWIGSGVPTQQPAPDRMAADLLRERGLLFFPIESVDPVESPPRTRSRRLMGYVTRDPEVMKLALMLTKVLDTECDHAMIIAARWVQGGYAADAALRWVTAGVTVPESAHAKSRGAREHP